MTNKQPEALRLAALIDKYNAGVHSQAVYEDYSAASRELRRQHARIVELEEQLSVAQQASEPYAVLVFERGEEGPFDRKPVKPGSVQHLHAKRDPHYDYIELYTHPPQHGMDAQRWQIVRQHISAEYSAGHACFVVRIEPVHGENIMRGSVAQHFTKAVDDRAKQIKIAHQAWLAAQAKKGGA